MTRAQAKAALTILQAWANGETVEVKFGLGSWAKLVEISDLNRFVTAPDEFRIKPKPREFWLVFDPGQSPRVFDWDPRPTECKDRRIIHVTETEP